MGALSGVYDSAFIQPVCLIKQNMSVWSSQQWNHFIVEYIEPLPPGGASIVDMVATAGATTLPALGTIQKRVVQILQLAESELLHVRMDVLDNVEAIVWEQSSQTKFTSKNLTARVDWQTRVRDPNLATTTFWVSTDKRDMNLEIRNPMAVALPQARVQFFGYRYILSPHPDVTKDLDATTKRALAMGDVRTVSKIIGYTTYVVAEGRQA